MVAESDILDFKENPTKCGKIKKGVDDNTKTEKPGNIWKRPISNIG